MSTFKYAVKFDFSHLVTRKLHKSHVLENYLITKMNSLLIIMTVWPNIPNVDIFVKM